jgi:hypothetical protein
MSGACLYNITFVLQLERGKLYCTKIDERLNELSLGVEEYLKYLVSVEETEESAALAGPSNTSLSQLKLLPVVDQVRNLLREGTLEIQRAADVLHYITLHHITLHHITSHYITVPGSRVGQNDCRMWNGHINTKACVQFN